MSEQTPRCPRCGEVIGMYEPAVVLIEGAPLRTSRLTAQADQFAGSPSFHADCFIAIESGSSDGP
jgi:hypothetical protein